MFSLAKWNLFWCMWCTFVLSNSVTAYAFDHDKTRIVWIITGFVVLIISIALSLRNLNGLKRV